MHCLEITCNLHFKLSILLNRWRMFKGTKQNTLQCTDANVIHVIPLKEIYFFQQGKYEFKFMTQVMAELKCSNKFLVFGREI